MCWNLHLIFFLNYKSILPLCLYVSLGFNALNEVTTHYKEEGVLCVSDVERHLITEYKLCSPWACAKNL